MSTATFITRLDGWLTDARLFELSSPHEGYDFVIVSANAQETYVFPADHRGTQLSHVEMPGSRKGQVSHTDVLCGMGYEPGVLEPTDHSYDPRTNPPPFAPFGALELFDAVLDALDYEPGDGWKRGER